MMNYFLVTGATSGLGNLVFDGLSVEGNVVIGVGLEDYDFRNPANVELCCNQIVDNFYLKDVKNLTIVNCAGVNEINYLQDLSPEKFDEIMAVNAKSNYLLAKGLFEQIEGGTILSIVSNAARIPMTSSLAYNASKAAQEMIVKQMARELWQTRKTTVFGINPNKLHSTGMTKYIDQRVCETRGWSEEEARSYQLKGLPIGEETDPKTLAEFICFLLSTKERHRYLHGCILPYGGPF